MMEIGIFYVALEQLGSNQQPVYLPDGRLVFIRVEVVECDNLSDSLDLAKPRRGESLLNTKPLSKEELSRE